MLPGKKNGSDKEDMSCASPD